MVVGDEDVTEGTQAYIGEAEVRRNAGAAVNYIGSSIDDNHLRTETASFSAKGRLPSPAG